MAATNIILTQLGNRITRRREQLGMTATELAMQANVAPETVSRIENGQRDIRFSNLCSIASALRVPLSSLQPEELDENMEVLADTYLLNEKLKQLSPSQRRMLLRMFAAQIDSILDESNKF